MMASWCPTVHTGYSLTIASLFLMYTLLCVPVPGNSASGTDKFNTYIHDGTICFKCSPGHFVFKHCVQNFSNSVCGACPEGTFQTEYTQAESCESCLPHCPDRNMNIVQNCTATTNLKCECKDGYFLISDKHAGDSCHRHTPCPPNQVVIKQGTSESEQVCGDCEDGTFYSNGRCRACTSCENGTELTACNSTQDVTCQGDGDTTGDGLPGTDGTGSSQTHHVVLTASLVPVCLIPILVAAVVVIMYRKHNRCRENPTNDRLREPSLPLLNMSGSSRRQRTFSGSSYKSVDTQEESEYPYLKDPSKWKQKVFDHLSCQLANNWKAVVRALPGNEDYKATIDARCDQICDEQRYSVKEQIYQALRAWAEENNPEDVTVDNIIITLQRTDGCRAVADNLRKFCASLNNKLQVDSAIAAETV